MVNARSLLPFLFICLFLIPQSGWSTEGQNSSFLKAARESDIHVPAAERDGAQFLEMNRARFEALASWKEFTCLIPNFPLASDGNYDLRVEQFDAVSKDIQGRFPVPAHVFFRGSVDGITGSHVCLAIYEDCVYGYINAGDKTYAVSGAGRATETGNLILGVAEDRTSSSGFACGVEDFRKGAISEKVASILQAGTHDRSHENIQSASMPQFAIGLEMDYPCVQHSGGTAVAAFKYGLAVVAAASDIYIRDAGMCLVCASHFEWDTPDNYVADTACDLLWEFDGTNIPPTSSNLAMYVLLSGRSLNWCGGVANSIGVLCQGITSRCICGITNSMRKTGWDYPYHIWTWDIMVATHEMGHLVACPHTFNCMWNPPLDSCVVAEGGSCYDQPVPRKGTIMSYCHTTSAGAILQFHPRCIDLIQQTIPTYSCGMIVPVPQIAISPLKQIHECSGGTFRFTLTASGSAGPYTFETNPPADSLLPSSNGCTVVLNPSKAQKFYVRVTDSASVRTYDSIVFLPVSGYQVQIHIDTTSVPGDSAILVADMPDTTGVTFTWYRLPNPLHAIAGTGRVLRVPRALAVQYAVRAASSGGCAAQDTVLLPPSSVTRSVVRADRVPFRLYPNPAWDKITIVLPDAPTHCWIEDVLGRRMDVPSSQTGGAPSITQFDVSHLNTGTYWMVRETSGTIGIAAFQKQ